MARLPARPAASQPGPARPARLAVVGDVDQLAAAPGGGPTPLIAWRRTLPRTGADVLAAIADRDQPPARAVAASPSWQAAPAAASGRARRPGRVVDLGQRRRARRRPRPDPRRRRPARDRAVRDRQRPRRPDRPAAAGGDDGYLVAWRGAGELRAAHLTPHGWAPAPGRADRGRRHRRRRARGGAWRRRLPRGLDRGRPRRADAVGPRGRPHRRAGRPGRRDRPLRRRLRPAPRRVGPGPLPGAWDDDLGATARVRATRVTAAGRPTAAGSSTPRAAPARSPPTAAAGWSSTAGPQPYGLVSLRTTTPAWLSDGPGAIAPAAEATALTWTGDRYVVVWSRAPG